MAAILEEHKILKFFKQHRLSYFISIALMLLASFVQTLAPRILGETVDIMRSDGFDKALVLKNISLLLLAAVGAFSLAYIWRRIFIGNSRKLECSLREDLFRHMQTLPADFYSGRKTGDLIAYAVNDIAAVRTAFGPAIAIALSGLVICVYSICFMAINIDLKLTLICLIPIPPLVVFIIKTGQRVQTNFKEVQKCFADISDRVQENISGIKVIKSYVQEDKEIEAFKHTNGDMKEKNLRLVRISSSVAPMIDASFGISFAVSLILGYRMIGDGSITLGEFISFNSYLTMIVRPITIIGRVINNLQMGLASVKRLDEIFSASSDIEFSPDAIDAGISGEIELKNICYSHKGALTPALNNVSLKIGAGQTIGITGKTGSGKSTLMNILIRCCDPCSGEVLLDGRNLRCYSEGTLKNSFSFVPQETFLFSSSVRDNITFFKDLYSDMELTEAALCSDIYETVTGFSKGFDTEVGERGADLSGGQQQRIAIARAVIRNSPVLILDDALSAVDSETEKTIVNNLREMRRGKTTIIISHKLSALKNADLIAVMDDGKIAEAGSEAELLAERGKYYDIYIEQNRQ